MKLHRSTLVGGEDFPSILFAGIKERIELKIKKTWQRTGLDESYISLLSRAMPFKSSNNQAMSKTQDRWMLLPGLCCQAAGGDFYKTDNLTASWYLYFIAAHIMDSVQDADDPDIWWKDMGVGLALNIASGLFFTANDLLTQFVEGCKERSLALKINNEFNEYLLSMCSGQHMDLYYKEKTLHQFWQANEHKSGSFFALACRAGARLAMDSEEIVSSYGRFGFNLGVIIQILDELEDLYKLNDPYNDLSVQQLCNTLPYVYLMEVLPEPQKTTIKKFVEGTPDLRQVLPQVINAFEESGTAMFILTMIEQRKEWARKALKEAHPSSPADLWLGNLLEQLGNKHKQ